MIKDIYGQLTDQVSMANRVYAVKAPELDPVTGDAPELPYVVFRRLNQVPDYTHEGYSNFGEMWFQVDCFAEGYEIALDLANEVIVALHGWSSSNDEVEVAFIDGVRDQRDPEPYIYHSIVTCKVWYKD